MRVGSRSVAHLESEGYVVLKQVLSDVEAAEVVDLTWEYMAALGTGVDRADVATWGNERWPFSVEGGIMPALWVGQSAPQWRVRGAPKVKQAFAAIWGTEELLTSFDGMSLWRPW